MDVRSAPSSVPSGSPASDQSLELVPEGGGLASGEGLESQGTPPLGPFEPARAMTGKVDNQMQRHRTQRGMCCVKGEG